MQAPRAARLSRESPHVTPYVCLGCRLRTVPPWQSHHVRLLTLTPSTANRDDSNTSKRGKLHRAQAPSQSSQVSSPVPSSHQQAEYSISRKSSIKVLRPIKVKQRLLAKPETEQGIIDGGIVGHGAKKGPLSDELYKESGVHKHGSVKFVAGDAHVESGLETVLDQHMRLHVGMTNNDIGIPKGELERKVDGHPAKQHKDKARPLDRKVASLLNNWCTPVDSRSQRIWQKQPSDCHLPQLVTPKSRVSDPSSRQSYHTSTRAYQSVPAFEPEKAENTLPDHLAYGQAQPPYAVQSTHKAVWHPSGIRAQLARWQEMHGEKLDRASSIDPLPASQLQSLDGDAAVENLTRMTDATSDSSARAAEVRMSDEERESYDAFSKSALEDLGAATWSSRFLQPGDLVEIEFNNSERESIIAVHLREMFDGKRGVSQFLSMEGRWIHVYDTAIQYSIPGWINSKMVDPLIKFLPNPQSDEDFRQLSEDAYEKDISIPRSISGPLVERMVQFWKESQEIYRRHASSLDDAHNILAHDTDLRYGSLTSAATTLLQISADQLPLPALFTVRKALVHAGFAFNIDRTSHRVTGYLQIRSKQQVKMLDRVRNWLRLWQDDLAATASMTEAQLKKHKAPRGAQFVYGFLQKSRRIVLRSRETRQPTPYGSIGPSKVKLAIDWTDDCVENVTGEEYTTEEEELVRFMESWACGGMFSSLPRILALPPLVLQATGLYDGYELTQPTGLLFLQELGTILPYENRVRFDQHLLLPNSQHSKPLENLMTALMEMKKSPGLRDSMRDLRHDWGNLPVYCIDSASAHEIDDGISIEPVHGSEAERWIHIHIANPTSHIPRDHALAKMARHMGESIYMPERAYVMLPRWATSRYFSLANNRPCLTISARMDARGKILEHKIRSGIVRNVIRLTYNEADNILATKGGPRAGSSDAANIVLTVGGQRPPEKHRADAFERLGPSDFSALKSLLDVAMQRQAYRQSEGGVFFDGHNADVEVWQNWQSSGLAWGHPYRRGSRVVNGDPVIEIQSQPFRNWFTASKKASDVLVSEMMLLACELAASWCAERQIPAIFRGTLSQSPHESQEYLHNTLLPAAANNGGEYPMHLGLEYIKTLGFNTLALKPVKHKVLGLNHYGKVTSPLRRYGDMILHWQIEAALREETRTGRSLVTEDCNADRSFLPFSADMLRTIMVGLQPREYVIRKAKTSAEYFWISMLMFRAFHFHETPLPFSTYNCYTYQEPPVRVNRGKVGCIIKELNFNAHMLNPVNLGLGKLSRGDTWECVIDHVDVYVRKVVMKPIRLVHRW